MKVVDHNEEYKWIYILLPVILLSGYAILLIITVLIILIRDMMVSLNHNFFLIQ